MERRAVRGLAAVLLVVALVAAAGVPATAAQETGTPSSIETDNTVTRIHLHPDGSATWVLQVRTRLETDEEVAAYKAYQRRFRNNTSKRLAPFKERVRGVVANAENATGRDMRVHSFNASTSIQPMPRRWGVVTYRFRWDNFAVKRDGRLVVGDVFQGGFFIAANDTLEVVAPDGYRVATVDPEPADSGDGVVSWQGKRDFADERPRVVVKPASAGPVGTNLLGLPLRALGSPLSAVLVAVGVIALVAAAMVARRRGGVSDLAADLGILEDAPTGGDGGTDAVDPPPHDGAGSAATGGAAAGAVGDAGGSDDPELLVDEDRVERALAGNGGRMKQSEIAEALDWSDSKTSRVLSRMTDEGTVQKLRLGRENVIDLVEDDGGEGDGGDGSGSGGRGGGDGRPSGPGGSSSTGR